MTGNLLNVEFNHGQAVFKFDGKPAAIILGILKCNGFRWSPSGQYWWRRGIAGAADIATAIERAENPGKPDGACWKCGELGRFRYRGAAAPVWCDACHEAVRAADAAQREETARQHARELACDDFDLMNNRSL